MRHTVELARSSAASGAGGPFASIVAKDGKVIAEGTNLVTSTMDPTAHAEIVSIRKACAALGTLELNECELYASCEPCPMCLGAIYWARPAAVYYCGTHKDAAKAGFDDSFIYHEIQLPVGERTIPSLRLLPELAWEPFEAWKQNPNKVPY